MYLVGDIGGTKTYFEIIDHNGKRISETKFPSKEYNCFSILLKEFLEKVEYPVEKACFGIAGPVINNQCQTTNLPWKVDGDQLAKELGINKVQLLNDLVANAYGICTLSREDFFVINEGKEKDGNQALISAGTGLGETGILREGQKFDPFPSEGGHSNFAPRNALEIRLLEYLIKKFSHVSVERVLSGIGIVNLFDFFVNAEKKSPTHRVLDELKQHEDQGKVIVQHGLAMDCEVCVKTLKLFVSLYGAEAGNVALKYLSVGGIYIGGGIAPKIIDQLNDGTFLQSFISKGRLSKLLEKMPVKVILKENTALQGAGYYLKEIM